MKNYVLTFESFLQNMLPKIHCIQTGDTIDVTKDDIIELHNRLLIHWENSCWVYFQDSEAYIRDLLDQKTFEGLFTDVMYTLTGINSGTEIIVTKTVFNELQERNYIDYDYDYESKEGKWVFYESVEEYIREIIAENEKE